ncbi:MAG TPA: iron-containing alcohol dehydrogenase [Syntrophobacteria bacterium]|nr:iron-containing alcohol dehydrogenase [Syntrophobacteria bacterium]
MDHLNIETLFNTSEIKRFHFPGKLLWGQHCRKRLFELVARQGRIAIFVDAYFANHDFTHELRQRYRDHLAIERLVSSMPMTDQIDRAVEALGSAPDVMIALGGGSTIDSAKAVLAHFLYGTYDGVGMGVRRGMPVQEGAVKPLFVSLPTTAGTGAEASRYYVAYDSRTRRKVHGKSWRLIADWILLDAVFLSAIPLATLVSSAFDAFVHYLESFLCRMERSWFGDMLSLDGMVRILDALDRFVYWNKRDESTLLQLLYAATLGGMAISNIRTGNIHEAAGALLEHTELTHSETLFVFFRAAYEQYRAVITDREELLMKRLREARPDLVLERLDDVIVWWERTYETCGLTDHIRASLARSTAPPEILRRQIFERLNGDRVWITKESPLPLDDVLTYDFIDSSLKRFTHPC